MSKTVRILLVDKSAEFKDTFKSILHDQNGIAVVGESRSIKQAVSLAADLKPDLVVLDLNLSGHPSGDLSNICNTLRANQKKLKIVITTAKESEDEVFTVLGSGADGYCLKAIDAKTLLEGIRSVVRGDFWLDARIGKQVLRTVDRRMSRYKAAESKHKENCDLSERELAVLDLVAQGLSNQQIASNLKISPETAKTHIRNIMKKLVVRDRTQAAVKGLRQGLI